MKAKDAKRNSEVFAKKNIIKSDFVAGFKAGALVSAAAAIPLLAIFLMFSGLR